MAALISWLDDHPLITILLVLVGLAFAVWAAWLFTVVTLSVFGMRGAIPNVPGAGGTVAAYATLFGITATLAGLIAGAKSLWQWRIDRHARREK